VADRVVFGPGRLGACREYLTHELTRTLGQRSALEATWRSWLELYRAPGDRGESHFPFEGASALTVPVAAMNVDPILARWMKTIHAADNLWTLAPLNERWMPSAKPLQDYLTWIDRMQLKMWDVNYRTFMETLKLGTGIYKTGWTFQRRQKWGYDAQKTRVRLLETTNRPFVDQVHLANFMLPTEARSIDPDAQAGAPWVAERHTWRPAQLRLLARGQEPVLPNFDRDGVERIIQHAQTSLPSYDLKVAALDQLSTSSSARRESPVEVWEVHLRFDTTGNGMEEDVVVFYHVPTQELLRATYEPMAFRPYNAIRYMRSEGFYGIGICEMAEVWQKITSRVLNFDVDKILLSNAPMLAVKEGANVVPDEPIFPGKQWHLTNPRDDILPLFLTAPGSFDIAALRAYLGDQTKQRVGLTDLQFGTVGALPSRTPATTIQSLLAEGNTRLDLMIADLRESGLSEVGLRVLQHLQTQANDPVNNPEASAYVTLAPMILGMPEGAYVAQALQIPSESIENGIGVSLTATSGTSNKELMRQSKLSLIQITSQLAPGFIQLAQLITQMPGTPVAQVAEQLFKGGASLLQDLLEQFDVRNTEDIVPQLAANLSALQSLGAGQSISPVGLGGGGGPAQGGGGFGGMAGF